MSVNMNSRETSLELILNSLGYEDDPEYGPYTWKKIILDDGYGYTRVHYLSYDCYGSSRVSTWESYRYDNADAFHVGGIILTAEMWEVLSRIRIWEEAWEEEAWGHAKETAHNSSF